MRKRGEKVHLVFGDEHQPQFDGHTKQRNEFSRVLIHGLEPEWTRCRARGLELSAVWNSRQDSVGHHPPLKYQNTNSKLKQSPLFFVCDRLRK